MALHTEKKLYVKTFTCLVIAALFVSPLQAKKVRAKGKTTILKRKSQPKAVLPGLFQSPFISWGIHGVRSHSTVNVLDAWKNYKKRKEVVVAVVDTGIDPRHPFLKDNLYVVNSKATLNNYGVDFAKSRNSKNQPFDTHGHGTHVSGIIKSVLPNVKIMALKYYNPTASGQDNLRSTIAALKYAVDHNVDIINYSGGGPEASIEERSILKKAEQKGILVVAAAGNEESNIDQRSNAYYPASYGMSNIITVTAHDEQLRTLSSSNWGKNSVDISAPGHRIRSALPKKRAGYLTGTSQATAFVSGAAALLMSQYPDLTAKDVKNILKNSARKEKTLIDKCASGGRLDVASASKLANQMKSGTFTRSVATRTKKGTLRKAN